MKDSNLIYGRHPVLDAIQSGTTIDKLMLQQGIRGEFEKEIRQLSKVHNIPVQVVPKERLNKVTRANHQGIIGYISAIRYYDLEDVLPMLYEKEEAPLILILDGITDVRNMGAIARSAEVLGAHALVVPKKGSAMIGPDAVKTSAGALNILPVCRENSLVKAVQYLINSGIQVLASDLKAEKQLSELDLILPTAIIVGSEGKGTSPALIEEANQHFVIPQKGETDSLNVSVATGIMLYEVAQQRREK